MDQLPGWLSSHWLKQSGHVMAWMPSIGYELICTLSLLLRGNKTKHVKSWLNNVEPSISAGSVCVCVCTRLHRLFVTKHAL